MDYLSSFRFVVGSIYMQVCGVVLCLLVIALVYLLIDYVATTAWSLFLTKFWYRRGIRKANKKLPAAMLEAIQEFQKENPEKVKELEDVEYDFGYDKRWECTVHYRRAMIMFFITGAGNVRIRYLNNLRFVEPEADDIKMFLEHTMKEIDEALLCRDLVVGRLEKAVKKLGWKAKSSEDGDIMVCRRFKKKGTTLNIFASPMSMSTSIVKDKTKETWGEFSDFVAVRESFCRQQAEKKDLFDVSDSVLAKIKQWSEHV